MSKILFSFLICILMTLSAQNAIGFKETSSAQTSDSTNVIPEKPALTPDQKKKMERNANIGKVMLGGIIILGILLFAIVLVIGNRFKRIAREPLPEAKPGDPLWYLKDKKAPDDQSEEENLPLREGESG